MSGSSHPALFWLGFAYAQRVTERGRSRGGGGGFRNVSFLHLQRTRQGREVGRPHGGRDGFRRGTKRSDAPTRGPLKLKPRRKGFLPFKLREALRKPRRLPAFNFGRRRRPRSPCHLRPHPSSRPPPRAPRPTRPRRRPSAPTPSSRPGLPRRAPGRSRHYLPRGWSSRRPLLRLRPPLQMETVVPVAQAAPFRLRSHSSSMPRAPQE